jgi:hypothetical protein
LTQRGGFTYTAKQVVYAKKGSHIGSYTQFFLPPHLLTHRAFLGAGNLLFFIELTKQEFFGEYINIKII